MSTEDKNFKKLKHGFVDERAMITMTLISSYHGKTLIPFSMRNKRPEKAFFKTICELLQNHTEKPFISSKTTVN